MIDVEAFKKAHSTFGLRIPNFKTTKCALMAKSTTGLILPSWVDNRDIGSKTKDQGVLPQCAAYTAASFAEHILRQRDGIVYNFDTQKIYDRAKELDGDKEDGTTLDHALQGFLETNPGYFPEDAYIYMIQPLAGYTNELKRLIVKYGCCMLGLAITDGWYHADVFSKGWIPSGVYTEGGHAVLAVGYNKNGVIIKNSWSTEWGEQGFAVLSWEDLGKQFIYGCTLIRCMNNFN